MTTGERIGEVAHFYNKISVAVLQLTKPLQTGDKIHFLGAHTDFPQEVGSMEIEHESVAEAAAGSEVAIKVDQRVRRGDAVFQLTD